MVVAGLEERVEALHPLHPDDACRRSRAAARGRCAARRSRSAAGARRRTACATGRGRRCRGPRPPTSAASAPRRRAGCIGAPSHGRVILYRLRRTARRSSAKRDQVRQRLCDSMPNARPRRSTGSPLARLQRHTADGVALHPARVRRGPQLAVLARTALTRPSDHGGATVTSWPRRRRSAIVVVAEARLDGQRPRLEAARVERRDQMVGVPLGRVDRLLQVEPAVDVADERRAAPTAPAGRRPACRRRATAPRRAGRGPATASFAAAFPGASDDGRPSSSQNICARVPSGQPSAGIVGELCSQPPLGVAESRFPNRSATSRWTVSPRVGSPAPSTAPAPLDERRQAPEPRPELAARVLADQRAALGGVLPREQPVERHARRRRSSRRGRRTRASPPR